MKTPQILLIVSLMMIYIDGGAGLKCYVCNDCDNPTDKDVKEATGSQSNPKEEPCKMCSIGAGGRVRSCFTQARLSNYKTMGVDLKSGCQDVEIEKGEKSEICLCDTDKCNGSQTLAAAVGTILAALLLAVFM